MRREQAVPLAACAVIVAYSLTPGAQFWEDATLVVAFVVIPLALVGLLFAAMMEEGHEEPEPPRCCCCGRCCRCGRCR